MLNLLKKILISLYIYIITDHICIDLWSIFSFLPAKRFVWALLLISNKMRVIPGDLSRMRVKAGDNFQRG